MKLMMRRDLLLVLALVWGILPSAVAEEAPLSRLAFGSCAKQDRPQPIWKAVVETEPELFVFLGDNIYGDTEDMDVLKAKYQQLGDQPGYQKLKAACQILATWDDHDYGINDGGSNYPKKRESQQVFLDFFDVPKEDVRRAREGVYSSHVFGPEGRRVQLILLDARYFRGPLKTGDKPSEPGDGYRGRYVPNTDPEATVLGEDQWRWLEQQLQVPAELRLIGSGIQVIADEHGWEMWGNFPRERERLFSLIQKTKAEGVVFLSGDRHLAEIARLPADHPLGVGYPLYDITSSSLNTASGNFTKAGTRFANEINSYRVGLTYFETNFGSVRIDWEPSDPLVRLQVRDEAGGVVLQQRLRLSELKPKEATTEKVGQVSQYQVTTPPADRKLPDFYRKYVDASGYPIVASGKVSDHALKEAAYIVDLMLAKRPDVRKAMVESGSRLIVMAHDEFTTDIPEYAKMKPKDYWDARARGLGGSRTDPVCSCAEENVLAYPGDPYHAESILIHEFAHNIHLRGMVRVDPTFDERLKKTYESAMANGLWAGVYASTNHHEYFAEGVQSWFDNNRPPDHDHNHVDTRKELREYDPGLAAICEEVFGDTQLVYTKPTTRLTGHLADYDPKTAPTFQWPERLKKQKEEIRQKAKAPRERADKS